jgi:hypothetical protein
MPDTMAPSSTPSVRPAFIAVHHAHRAARDASGSYFSERLKQRSAKDFALVVVVIRGVRQERPNRV